MPINLSKGQKVDLTKGNPGLKSIMVGLGWDVNAFDTGADFDLDAAAFMLGAKGVQMGTRFVVTKECQVHPAYKERIIRAKDIDTRVTGRSTGHPIRALRNDMTKAYLQKEQEGASTEELELLASGALRRAVQEGDIHNGSLMSGQIAGLIKEEVSCKQLIDTLVSQTKEALNRSRMYE